MKKFKKIKKKPLIFIISLFLITVIGGTFAYYYTDIVIPNRFKTMTYDVAIEEEFYDDWGTKKVFFVNKEDEGVPVVIRYNFNEIWTDTNDNPLEAAANIVTKNWIVNNNTSLIPPGTYYNDGWYYLPVVLEGGESVQVLDSVTLIDNSYLSNNYQLIFNYEAIQANEEAINSLWNKNATIEGSEITWS